MATPFIIIDGYNLLHAAGLARVRYAPGDLERQRRRLLAMLAEKLTPAEKLRCTVVFDAQDAPFNDSRESRVHDVAVVFAPQGGDADTVIEDLLDHHPAAKQVLMISGDHRLHKAARRRGATPMDSEPFWEQLRQSPDQRQAITPPSPVVAPKIRAAATKPDVAAWMKEFGEVSVDEIAAEVRAEDQTMAHDPWQNHLGELERMLDDPRLCEHWLNQRQNRPSG
ncbi:MAG: NYN domain-containing protein [Planctomycetaceae bacterium]|nr:NYN domain-containing protein [Planctomycetaceae bacterium]